MCTFIHLSINKAKHVWEFDGFIISSSPDVISSQRHHERKKENRKSTFIHKWQEQQYRHSNTCTKVIKKQRHNKKRIIKRDLFSQTRHLISRKKTKKHYGFCEWMPTFLFVFFCFYIYSFTDSFVFLMFIAKWKIPWSYYVTIIIIIIKK